MNNDRPIDDPKLQAALDEVKRIMDRYGFAGACMLVAPREAAFTYGLHAPWSAFRPDPSTPLGFRLRARTAEDGKELTIARVEGAMHTICQLGDFGLQTTMWMEDLLTMARRAGIEVTHTPFNGRPPQPIIGF
jgi:hypothetical protein